MRLSTVLDLMGLQAVRQGQITNNWLNQGPDYWLRKIEDKQLFLCLCLSSLPRHPHPQAYCVDYTVPLMINGRFCRPPLLQQCLPSSSVCFVASPCFKRYTYFPPWLVADLEQPSSHPLTLEKVSPDLWASACLPDRRESRLRSATSQSDSVTITNTVFSLQHKVKYWLHFFQGTDCRELQTNQLAG